MRKLFFGVVLAALVAAPRAGAQAPETESSPEALPGVPVTRLSFAEPGVEVADPDGPWRSLPENERLRTGQRLRTGAHGVARLEFPFMGLTVGPDSELRVPPGVVLSMHLERGRVEVASERGEIIKLLTPEAEVRGQGRVILERREGVTLALAFSGRLRVASAAGRVVVAAGQGTRVRAGAAPEAPRPLPPAPTALSPGDDPPYAQVGEPVELRWSPPGERNYVEVLSIDQDVVLLAREVGPPPFTVRLPWPGTFRWRVTARTADGFASLPSAEGLIPVMRK